MKLAELLKQVAVVSLGGPLSEAEVTEAEVTGVSLDSRRVRPGNVFVAVSGAQRRGADYIPDALERGALAVVTDEAPRGDAGDAGEVGGSPHLGGARAVWVRVANVRRALADLACAYYGMPAGGLRVAGVTGTNGKTTTTFLIQHICNAAMLRCGLVGTVRYEIGERVEAASRTTPDAIELQELLGRMRDAGCKSVAMEVSSHALEQERVRGVDFDAAVFTNLTRDHLDFHGTMDSYFEAKAGLILGLSAQRFKVGTAVINVDDRLGALLSERAAKAGVRVLGFGFGQRADFRASNARTDMQGSSFQLDAVGRSWLVRLPLIGMFNILNALGAIAAANAMGVDVRTAVLALASAPPVPGRLEPVPGKRSFRIFVDYAHTEDALRTVLRTLRELQPRRLICVFGCGGDRDAGKRPMMGAVAEEYADWTVVTSDNPRSESPEVIAAQITSGMRQGRHEVVLDRKAAIQRAVEMACARDIVLIAGKGHETTQETAGRLEPFDDVAVARGALENRPAEFVH